MTTALIPASESVIKEESAGERGHHIYGYGDNQVTASSTVTSCKGSSEAFGGGKGFPDICPWSPSAWPTSEWPTYAWNDGTPHSRVGRDNMNYIRCVPRPCSCTVALHARPGQMHTSSHRRMK
jgi:hypothetical protein